MSDKKQRKEALYCFIRNGNPSKIDAQLKKVMQLQSELNTSTGKMSILKTKKDGTTAVVESKISAKKVKEYYTALKKLEYLKAPAGITYAGVFIRPNVMYIGRSKKFQGGKVLKYDSRGFVTNYDEIPPDTYTKSKGRDEAYAAAVKTPEQNNGKNKIAIIEIKGEGKKGLVKFFLETCEILNKICTDEKRYHELMKFPLKYTFEPELELVKTN